MTHDRERAVAWAGLIRACEPPVPAVLWDFVIACGPEEAWDALVEGAAPNPVLAAVHPRLNGLDISERRDQAEADVDAAAAAGAEIVGWGEPDWPEECFNRLHGVAPYDRGPEGRPPLALYRRGGAWPTAPRQAVSIIGSRAATAYGTRVAADIAAEAVDAGMTVVSGAAFGIDAAAHRGALSTTGAAGRGVARPTVAVLSCGIDRSYPSAHRSLLDSIATVGAVVSEYPPGAVPARHRFLVRNRLIAAWSQATVVVEAGRRSGSLNTATTANLLVRDVLAVPGPVTSALSMGCHDLIRDEKARLVTGWPDVEVYCSPLAPGPSVHRPNSRPTDGLDLISGRVHDALPSGAGSVTVDAIAREAGLDVPDVLSGLIKLDLAGLVARTDDGWHRR